MASACATAACGCNAGAARASRPLLSKRAQGLSVALGALTGGLLSSSCCLLQLALNSLSVGCAGFSALTPYQPLFRLTTVALLAYLLGTQGLTRRTAATLAAALLLMGSQGALRLCNTGELGTAVERWLQQRGLDSAAARWLRPAPPPLPPSAQRLTLRVRGLRCEGCAARLRGALERVEGVRNATVHFAEARVEVWADAQRERVVDELLGTVAAVDSSYAAAVTARACFDAAGGAAECSVDAGSTTEL